MSVTSIKIDPVKLDQAKKLTGTKTNRETVDLAMSTLIAVRSQPAVVARIISRKFSDEQLTADTLKYPLLQDGDRQDGNEM